jgi:hypothetical protein
MDQGPRACFFVFSPIFILSNARLQHGTCPTCRHEFHPGLHPVDSDAESSDGGEYVPTEYEVDSDLDTDYEDGLMDSDGIDVETMDVEPPQLASTDETTEGNGHDVTSSSPYRAGYHDSRDVEAQSVCESEAAWWDGSVDDEQEWGLTDGDSMSTSEGELSVGERFSGRAHSACCCALPQFRVFNRNKCSS